MDKLFNRDRLPVGLKLVPVLIYLPVGGILGFIRFFIGLQTLLAAALLQKLSNFRTLLLRGMCCTLGLVIREDKSSARNPSIPLIVSNHVSIMDHVAFHLTTGSASLCTQNTPLIIQHAFRFKNLEKSRISISDCIDVQPEGAVTNGCFGLLRFKTIPSNISRVVQPATLRIWRPPLIEVSSNTLGATWLADLLWFLIVPVTIITIKYLPPLKQEEGESDEEWTRRMEQVIAEDLGVKVTEYTAASKSELERQLLPVDAQLRLLGPAQMAVRLKETFPSLSLEVIRAEIERTKNVRVAIANLGRLRAEKSPGGSGAEEAQKPVLDIAASNFPRSAQDRMAAFQERKARLIETARKRYIEKRALNVASS